MEAFEDCRDAFIEVALDAGVKDLSNFRDAFRAEFGVSPRVFSPRNQNRATDSRPAAIGSILVAAWEAGKAKWKSWLCTFQEVLR